MSFEAVLAYFASIGMADRVRHLEQSSATVELAARAVGTAPCQIAKTMSFMLREGPILIVAAGDVRIDNKKFKAIFGQKAKMIPPAEVEAAIGHAPGGVCPFVTRPGVAVWLDESLKRFDVVYPAAGDDRSAVGLSPSELERTSAARAWINVCTES